jgi:PAS domain S-box-containing protein
VHLACTLAAHSNRESLRNMPDLPAIYNSRILKLYAEFLQANYPSIDIESILHQARISKYELDDPGHWFNQQQVDRFHEKVVDATGNKSIARDAGRFAASADASGPVKQRVYGLIRVSSFYLLLAKLYPLLSRGAEVVSRKLSNNCVEISVVPYEYVQESPHQCENRIGFFEAMATISTGKFAEIEHLECVHKGDPRCRYKVSWEEPLHRKWKRYLLISLTLTIACVFPAFFLLSTWKWLILLLTGGLGLSAIGLRALYLETQDLTHKIQSQGNVAEDHINEIDYRYRGALLVQKIGQATSMILDVNQLVQVVMKNIQHYLDFDRGIIMLADDNREQLVYTAGYGFDKEMTKLLVDTRFRLDNSKAKGIFIQTFYQQRAILVDDIDMLRDSFSQRSQIFATKIGSKSLICLPIVYEGNSIGILAVDNIITKRPLTKSDMNLLMGVAYQTAASIFSAKAFRDLQESEERFRSLYENAPTAYVSIRMEDAVIVNCNAVAVDLLGYERQQLIGSSLIDHMASDEESQLQSQWLHELLLAGQPARNESLQLVHKSGHCVRVNISLEPFKDVHGHIVEGRCIIIDMTEQYHLEEQLRDAQRMEAIGTLAGGVAHDLSNILSAIVCYPDLLLMDIAPDSPMYDPLMKIKGAGSRAAAIVHDLLTLARRGVAVPDVVQVNSIIKEYLASPEYDDLIAHNPKVQLETNLDENLHVIKGSEIHLTKTLMNIISNAAEAMPDGGSIRLRTYNELIAANDPRLKGEGGKYIVLSVTDTGQGMSPEDIKRVFEPFFTKKKMGRSGTGLGMAIVWAAVQDLNGFVDIDSRLGQGTTVRLYYPATFEKKYFHTTTPLLMDELKGHGEVVLLVEDDTEHREIAARMLSRLGYQVIAVDSGEAALAELEKTRPDLVILDMILGSDLDGLSTYRRILDLYPEQRAIIISGFAESARVKKALELGVGAYIKKPYNLKEISTKVRYELDR